ncbi:hypothetical protein FDI40_gp061 [Agrobacterium phage Atu_ph07]|uniref:Uncharacterized protein n=1 Tax=Agrobacterium phage Atu_ph07 TaxID=2024264 RepID=A0A2L0UZB4_9CAUD|nr:hypothetical protein FDI40_gp061 [Agrobacterium phage Atu_ph07]AUZ94873.1 hypothetical protein [Agrobacterium phage Atu_ph07]
MKWHQLTEAVTDVQDITTLEQLTEYVNTHCKEYVQQNPNWVKRPLYRGIKIAGLKDIQIRQIRQDRKPRDSSNLIQTQIDDYLSANGFKALRGNSIFCTSSQGSAVEFGKEFVIFPIGHFDFTWNPKFDDLTVDIKDMLYIVPSDEKNIYVREMSSSLAGYINSEFKKQGIEMPDVMSSNELIKIIGDRAWNEDLRTFFHKQNMLQGSEQMLDLAKSYQDTDFNAAMESKNEIMITGKEYLAISLRLFREFVKYGKAI